MTMTNITKDEKEEYRWAKGWFQSIYYDMKLDLGLEEFDKDVQRLNRSLTSTRRYYQERITEQDELNRVGMEIDEP